MGTLGSVQHPVELQPRWPVSLLPSQVACVTGGGSNRFKAVDSSPPGSRKGSSRCYSLATPHSCRKGFPTLSTPGWTGLTCLLCSLWSLFPYHTVQPKAHDRH